MRIKLYPNLYVLHYVHSDRFRAAPIDQNDRLSENRAANISMNLLSEILARLLNHNLSRNCTLLK